MTLKIKKSSRIHVVNGFPLVAPSPWRRLPRCSLSRGDKLPEHSDAHCCASGSDIIGYEVTDMAMPLLETA